MTLTNNSVGVNYNILGDESVQIFTTNTGSIAHFNFHCETTEGWAQKKAASSTPAGHTLIVGGTGSGKTTFIEFLLASSYKYPDLKIRMFDSLGDLIELTEKVQ